MPKKKHRKKARSSKRAATQKSRTPAPHGTRPKQRGRHHSAHTKADHPSLSLLRAIKRRREAEHGSHSEPHGVGGSAHRGRKGGASHHARKHGPHHAEPVVTEKSFENLLAFRRFQNHAR